MRHVFVCVIALLLSVSCGCSHSQNEKVDDILSEERKLYEEFIGEREEDYKAYAFVHISGLDVPALLLAKDTVFEVSYENKSFMVAGSAEVYAKKGKKIYKLGYLKCESPAFCLAVDQMGYVFQINNIENVACWKVDDEMKLSKVEHAYIDYNATAENKYKHFINQKEVEASNEAAIQSLHTRYGEASPIRFVLLN